MCTRLSLDSVTSLEWMCLALLFQTTTNRASHSVYRHERVRVSLWQHAKHESFRWCKHLNQLWSRRITRIHNSFHFARINECLCFFVDSALWTSETCTHLSPHSPNATERIPLLLKVCFAQQILTVKYRYFLTVSKSVNEASSQWHHP